jgi:hypothetical protein
MILKSVRVENFKCIEDSNEFSIEPVSKTKVVRVQRATSNQPGQCVDNSVGT